MANRPTADSAHGDCQATNDETGEQQFILLAPSVSIDGGADTDITVTIRQLLVDKNSGTVTHNPNGVSADSVQFARLMWHLTALQAQLAANRHQDGTAQQVGVVDESLTSFAMQRDFAMTTSRPQPNQSPTVNGAAPHTRVRKRKSRAISRKTTNHFTSDIVNIGATDADPSLATNSAGGTVQGQQQRPVEGGLRMENGVDFPSIDIGPYL